MNLDEEYRAQMDDLCANTNRISAEDIMKKAAVTDSYNSQAPDMEAIYASVAEASDKVMAGKEITPPKQSRIVSLEQRKQMRPFGGNRILGRVAVVVLAVLLVSSGATILAGVAGAGPLAAAFGGNDEDPTADLVMQETTEAESIEEIAPTELSEPIESETSAVSNEEEGSSDIAMNEEDTADDKTPAETESAASENDTTEANTADISNNTNNSSIIELIYGDEGQFYRGSQPHYYKEAPTFTTKHGLTLWLREISFEADRVSMNVMFDPEGVSYFDGQEYTVASNPLFDAEWFNETCQMKLVVDGVEYPVIQTYLVCFTVDWVFYDDLNGYSTVDFPAIDYENAQEIILLTRDGSSISLK